MKATSIAAVCMVVFGLGSASAQSVHFQPATFVGMPNTLVNVDVRVSAPEPCTFVQFTLDYQSSVVTFISATIGTDLAAAGLNISNLVTNPVFPPSTPQTDRNLVVQIFGGGVSTFMGTNLRAATLTFRVNAGSCDATPLAFETSCNPNTHLVTLDLETICSPTLHLGNGTLASSCATDVGTGAGVQGVRLFQNVPNPFNPTTTIQYSLESPEWVRLEVLDAAGRIVRVLVDGNRDAGGHEARWNGRTDQGRRVASGLYYYRLSTSRGEQSRRMLLVK